MFYYNELYNNNIICYIHTFTNNNSNNYYTVGVQYRNYIFIQNNMYYVQFSLVSNKRNVKFEICIMHFFIFVSQIFRINKLIERFQR